MTDQKKNSTAPDQVDRQGVLTSLISNPQAMNAFGEKLQSYVGQKSEFIAFLPVSIKRRLKALKRLQQKSFNIEGQFFEEVHKLECKFASLYSPLFHRRKDIITAVHEPTDEECTLDEVEDEDEEEDDDKTTDSKDKTTEKSIFPEDTKGIPEFWLSIIKNTPSLSEHLTEEDESVLKHLVDVRVEYSSTPNNGFQLFFDFADNDFLKQSTLTKKYTLRMGPDPESVMSYDGPEIVKCEGCDVEWKEGNDVTVDKEGTKKDSFFNFFKPPVIDDEGALKPVKDGEEKEKLEEQLMSDYDMAHLLKSSVIPRAVFYYTGEALEEDDYDDESDEEDEDYDEDKDPDYKPAKGQDCKQQ